MLSHRYPHRSTGTLLFDPMRGTRFFEPWWLLLECDSGIVDYLLWHLLRHGIDLDKGSRWGAHISAVKGEEPLFPQAWGREQGLEVEFFYGHTIHWANGYHVWVEVLCPELTLLRKELGLWQKDHARYHLTLGRLRSRPSGGYLAL